MKIAIVCPYYPFPPSVGGVETIVRNVSTELAKREHEVHIVTTPFDVTTMKQVSDYGIEERDDVIIHKLRPGRLRIGYARFLKGLRETIREIKPDVVHSHNLHPHLFQLAKWKKKYSYKLIAELHHPAVELDFLVQRILFPFVIIALKRIGGNVDAFIAHTIMEKKWLISKGIKSRKIHVIRLPGISSKLLKTPLVRTSPYDIVFVGRIVWRKGLHVLVKSLSDIKNTGLKIKIHFAGPAEPGYLRKLITLIREFKLEHMMTYEGRISEDKKYELIRQHKIFVQPSIKDYTPNAIVEAQALGIPVVASKIGAIPELVKDGETGVLVKPGDPYELVKAIKRLLLNESFRRNMSVKAREFAKRFILEKRVNELEKLYECLLNA